MAMSVQTNMSSLVARNNLSRTQTSQEKVFQRLSTGLRINGAADDAAGLAVADSMKAQNRSLQQAQRNVEDGVSLLQTADGGSAQISDILIRMRELAVQSANGTYSDTDRANADAEFQELLTQIDEIATGTEFNGTALLDGSTASVDIQAGFDSTDDITLTLTDLDATALAVNALDITTAANADASIAAIDSALTDLNTARAQFGAFQNRLESSLSNLGTQVENLTASESRIRDADLAQESANLAKYQILQQAGISVLSQSNSSAQSILSLLR